MGRRAVFADRDGTIIEDRNYVADPAHVTLIPGSASALNGAGHGLRRWWFTNQSGIGRSLHPRGLPARGPETDRPLRPPRARSVDRPTSVRMPGRLIPNDLPQSQVG